MPHKALVFTAALTSGEGALAAYFLNISVVPNGPNDLAPSDKLPVPVGLALWSEELVEYCDPVVQQTLLNSRDLE